jgi:hypothetical protein
MIQSGHALYDFFFLKFWLANQKFGSDDSLLCKRDFVKLFGRVMLSGDNRVCVIEHKQKQSSNRFFGKHRKLKMLCRISLMQIKQLSNCTNQENDTQTVLPDRHVHE